MKVGIIGAGKVGISLAHAMKKKGVTVTAVSDVDRDAALNMAYSFIGEGTLYTADNSEVVNLSEVIAVTTQDREIRDVVAGIDSRFDDLSGKLIFHTSGVDPSSILSPLDRKGALLGSLHPLQTFPDIERAIEVLPETYIFIEGEERSARILAELGNLIGRSVMRISAEDKACYHLSAVFVCNLLSALFYAGKTVMGQIGIGFEPFLPIIRATMENIENMGPLMALTGPVVRGDTKTILAHLEVLKDMDLEKKVYRALSLVALQMAAERKTVSDNALERLRHVLEVDYDQ
jgi:predicted short-subunit dehydrogenase-like oxidoreductase (DUF2520 family)